MIEPFKDSHNGNASEGILGYVECMAKHMAMQCIIYVKSILGRFDELHFCKTSMLTQTSV